MPWRDLARALGPATWRCWTALLTLRDAEGDTHATTETIAAQAQLSEGGVKRALARLRRIGLVEDIGWYWLPVPCRCRPEEGPHLHEVYLRRVFGGLPRLDGQPAETVTAQVPARVGTWALTAPGHGGKRAKAGRPVGIAEKGPRKPRTLAVKAHPVDSNRTPYKNLRAFPEREAKASLSENAARRAARPDVSFSSPIERAVSEAAGTLRLVRPAPGPAEKASEGAQGVSMGGETAAWLDEVGWSGGGSLQRYSPADLAAIPSLAAVEPAVIPAPPRMPADDADVERACRRAYSTAHVRVFGRRPYASGLVRRMDPAKWLPAARALREEGIPPLAWALFVMREVWVGKMEKKSAPTAHFVWDAAKVEKWARWCRDSVGTMHTGRTVWTPALRDLAERIAHLRAALGRGEPTAQVVARVFPATQQRVLMARAAAEAEQARASIERRIEDGEWLWGGL